jgi:hypothetical protein
MPTHYELGPSGRGPCLSCSTFEDLLRVSPHLPPGKYWITCRDCGESVDGTAWEEVEDWGTLEVREPEDWKLESLAGFIAGPGHVNA